MLKSVEKAQNKSNEVASYFADIHGDAGTIALFLLRVRRQDRDVGTQAMRDMIADEIKQQRAMIRQPPLPMQFIGVDRC